MKKLIAVALAATMALCVFAGCSKKESRKTDEINEMIEEFEDSKKVKVKDFEEIYDLIIEEADGASDEYIEELGDCLNEAVEVAFGRYEDGDLDKSEIDEIIEMATSKEVKKALGKGVISNIEEYLEDAREAASSVESHNSSISAVVDQIEIAS